MAKKNKGGRPKGAHGAKTLYVKKRAVELNVDPVIGMLLILKEIEKDLLKAMKVKPKDRDQKEIDRLRSFYCSIAKDAAPYIHSKLQSIEHSGEIGHKPEDRLDELE